MDEEKPDRASLSGDFSESSGLIIISPWQTGHNVRKAQLRRESASMVTRVRVGCIGGVCSECR